MIKALKQLVGRYYKLFLFFVVLVSYGQLLGMGVWQDDNALFFKLAHIEKRAGYLGAGPFGIGPYKYIQTPYIPIYKIFGHDSAAYFALAILLYFAATLSVYKVFSTILGKLGGRVSGFLFAAGYIASDGFIRLFNTVVTSLSVILVSFLTFFYWKFYKERNYGWYILVVLFYFLAVEFARGRTHYLIAVVLFFELVFLAFRNFPKSLLGSFLRALPFVFVFYRYFVLNADRRSGNIGRFVKSLLRGELHLLYGWFSSLANTLFPDRIIYSVKPSFLWLGGLAVFILILFFWLRGRKRKKLLFPPLLIICLVWLVISGEIFTSPVLNLGETQKFLGFLGGLLLIAAFLFTLLEKKYRKVFLFLSFWMIVNIGAYSAYNPTVSYETINRYLAHSFYALVGIFGLFFVKIFNDKSFLSKSARFIILGWGFLNIVSSVAYQRNILNNRSFPVKKFYQELKSSVPYVGKGDVFYFDVAAQARGLFADAFSVASMPETTAIAWRYGVDRYDIYRVTEFDELIDLIKEKKVPLDKIHSFFYSKEGLVDTSVKTREILEKGTPQKEVAFEKKEGLDEIILEFLQPFDSFTPLEIEFVGIASTLDPEDISFPLTQNNTLSINRVSKDRNLRTLAFEYKGFKEELRNNSEISTTSDWRGNIGRNLIDGKVGTLWQADRVKWGEGSPAVLTLDLRRQIELDRFVFMNAYGNNTPVLYSIEISLDLENWKKVKDVSSLQRIDSSQPQVVVFSGQKARFVRMTINKTLGGDSPGISEVWVVPSGFSILDIAETEEFLNNPFGYVGDLVSFKETLSNLDFKGDAKVSWLSDEEGNWKTQEGLIINFVYDGIRRKYKVDIPPSGTKIFKVKLSKIEIPGSIELTSLKIRYPSLKEIISEN